MAEFTGMDAVQAIVVYFARHGSELPDHIYNKLVEKIAGPDGLGTMDCALEGLYAVSDEIGQEGRELLRDLSRFIADKGFLGKRDRATEINIVVLRILDGGPIEAEGDPEVADEFKVPPKPVEPEQTGPVPQ